MNKLLISGITCGLLMGSTILAQAITLSATYYNPVANAGTVTSGSPGVGSVNYSDNKIQGNSVYFAALPVSGVNFSFGDVPLLSNDTTTGSGIGTTQFTTGGSSPAFTPLTNVTYSIAITITGDTAGAATLTSALPGNLIFSVVDGTGTALPGAFANPGNFQVGAITTITNPAGRVSTVYNYSNSVVIPTAFTGFGFDLRYNHTAGITGLTGNIRLSTVPEPSTVAFALTGGMTIGAGLLRRRFRK